MESRTFTVLPGSTPEQIREAVAVVESEFKESDGWQWLGESGEVHWYQTPDGKIRADRYRVYWAGHVTEAQLAYPR